LNNVIKDKNLNILNKEIVYEKKIEDNKGIYYYPLKRNFASIEEEKNYIHYYGEDNIDRVSRINDSLSKKENFIQDDVITNFIFIYLMNYIQDYSELMKVMKITLKLKNITQNDIIKRAKLLYDRYHGLINDSSFDFWFMSCKQTDNKNILSLFQNNKQLYCSIDNIYDCSFHTAIDSNFDNPSCYDQVKYLRTYKQLLEYSLFHLVKFDSSDDKDLISDEAVYHIDNNDSVSNISTKYVSNPNINGLAGNKEEENITDVIVEDKCGNIKTINLINNNEKNNNLKKYIIKSIINYNNLLKNLKCNEEIVSQVRKIREGFYYISNITPCSELCYKNLLLCEDELINKAFKETISRKFPIIYELLFMKFIQMVKFNPCYVYKLMKQFIGRNKDFSVDCYEIYFHMISSKYEINKIIRKKLLDLNLKEKDPSRKKYCGSSSVQSRRVDDKTNFKSKYLPYTPCSHFGNEACNDNCICSERGYCEIYCKCNKSLCKFTYHGCHCSKGDCCSNHCPCYFNARECDPSLCKNCYKNGSKCKNRQILQNMQAKILVGISKIAGWGLFANEDIRKDALIGEYKGEIINEDTTNKRDRFKMYENSTYMFTLDDEFTVDSKNMGNMLRYANHSKKNANAYPRVVFSGGHHRIGLFAKRHIYKGEEIRFDYDGQGILSTQFEWINDELSNDSDIINFIKKKKQKRKICLISKGSKKDKDKYKNHNNIDINDETKFDSSNLLNSIEDKEKIENNKKDNKNEENTDNNIDKSDKSRIIRINKDDKFINLDNNNNNYLIIGEKKVDEENQNNINTQSNNLKDNQNGTSMIGQKLLNRKRYIDNENKDDNNKENKDNEVIKSSSKHRKSKCTETQTQTQTNIQEFFNRMNIDKKPHKDMMFEDKHVKLIGDKSLNLIENKMNRVINHDLGTIRVLINFENPIIADFSFFGPKNTDFFKKYDILKFESLDILDTIQADLNNDIYGYLINGNFNRGHLILVSYLKFFDKRVYFYRNENLRINIYIFGKGPLRDLILRECHLIPGENKDKLTFLIKTG